MVASWDVLWVVVSVVEKDVLWGEQQVDYLVAWWDFHLAVQKAVAMVDRLVGSGGWTVGP